jgi:SET domain
LLPPFIKQGSKQHAARIDSIPLLPLIIMGLHEAVHVRSFATYGYPCYGLFVKEGCVIPNGTPVWWHDPEKDSFRTFTKEQISNAPTHPMSLQEMTLILGAPAMIKSATTEATGNVMLPNPKEALLKYSYMVDDDCFASTPYPEEDPSYYFNHSCDPNIAFRGHKMVTLKDISAKEQLFYDYAFTETQDSLHYGMICRCGAWNCRGSLDFLQYKDPAFIHRNFKNCTSFIRRKMLEHGWVHNSVVLRHVHCNPKEDGDYGLFACQTIPRGTQILTFAGKVVSSQFVSKLPIREKERSLQIDDELWQIPHPIRFFRTSNHKLFFETGEYINHSCQPNCGMMDSVRVVTIRDITANEQVTIDYAMVNKGPLEKSNDTFCCDCGSSNCRGTINAEDYKIVGRSFFDYMTPIVKAKYMKGLTRDLQQKATMTTASSSSTNTSSPVFSTLFNRWNFSFTDDDDDDYSHVSDKTVLQIQK